MGYTDVGMPLAVIEVDAGVLRLRVRPSLVRWMFGIENLEVFPDPGTVIYPARKFGQTGIEIRRERTPSYYFWTAERSNLLATLAAAGFQVSTEENQMTYRTANRALRARKRSGDR